MRSVFLAAAAALAFTFGGPGWAAAQTCGNGAIEATEECDDGGICIGSNNAGTACTSAAQCPGGVCKTFGGDGCAANCTAEQQVPYEMVPGVVQGLGIRPGTSGLVAETFISLPIPLSGRLGLTIGKERNGQIPMVVQDDSVEFPGIDVMNLACGCVRGAEYRTCGGTFMEPDGTLSRDCTFNANACNGLKPCAALHGPGNTASGVIGCNMLDGVNLSYSIDAGGETGEALDPVIELSGTGGPGSASILTTIGVDVVLGRCTGTSPDYGPDGIFCTDDDQPSITLAATNPAVTGTATALVSNLPDGGEIGPVSITGAPFSCSKLAVRNPGGASLVSAFGVPDVDTIGSLAVKLALVAQENDEPISCLGDCNGDGEVTVDEIITMVNIALGAAQPSGCAAGDGNGDGEVTVDEIVSAVNRALGGC
jgi:hypothetical protein